MKRLSETPWMLLALSVMLPLPLQLLDIHLLPALSVDKAIALGKKLRWQD